MNHAPFLLLLLPMALQAQVVAQAQAVPAADNCESIRQHNTTAHLADRRTEEPGVGETGRQSLG